MIDWLTVAERAERWTATRCVACGGGRARHAVAFCSLCAQSVEPLHEHTLTVGGRALVAAFAYRGAIAQAIGAMKFDGAPVGWAGALGPWRRQVRAMCGAAAPIDTIVAVPPQSVRLRVRGWHLPDLLVTTLAAGSGLRAPLALRRTDRAPPRARGGRELPRFAIRAGVDRARVLLVDDVVTTGATLARAIAALEDERAEVVACAALAYAGAGMCQGGPGMSQGGAGMSQGGVGASERHDATGSVAIAPGGGPRGVALSLAARAAIKTSRERLAVGSREEEESAEDDASRPSEVPSPAE